MDQKTNDLLLAGIQRQIQEAAPTIAQALRKGTDIELRIDTFGHLRVVEVRKKSLNIR